MQGTFAMVVTRNGNTDGYCIGTGEPYRIRTGSPFNPYTSFGGPSGFGNSLTGNPFSQYFGQGQ